MKTEEFIFLVILILMATWYYWTPPLIIGCIASLALGCWKWFLRGSAISVIAAIVVSIIAYNYPRLFVP